MNANQAGCRYDCGLDHVYLEGYPLPETGGTECIDRINELNRLVANRVALRSGPLRGNEIRFLREHLELTPEELDDRIDFGTGLIQLAETGNWSMPRESDVELRRLIFQHHEEHVPSLDALYALYTSIPYDLVIRICRAEESDIGWKHAA